MPFQCTFTFIDEFDRKTRRTWGNDQALIATVLTDIAAIVPLYQATGQGGVAGVTITQKDTSEDVAAETPSNVDENASIQVLGADGFAYDFNLPMPDADIRDAGGVIDVADADVVAFIAEFQGAKHWTINERNPTQIASIVKGVLDT